jgi:hypothetical protein
MERWRDTLKWREDKKADYILTVPHPEYDVVQTYYPQSWYCRDKAGHIVYIERPGGVDLNTMKKNGISVQKLLWHYMYCCEYLWQVTSPKETDRLTTILDLQGVRLLNIVGNVRKFITLCVTMTSTHYPARGHKLFIINSPSWFGTIWSWVKPMLNPAIDEKLKICTTGQKQIDDMLVIIDKSELPKCYGGENVTVFGKADVDLKLRKHVLDVLEKNGMTMQVNKTF